MSDMGPSAGWGPSHQTARGGASVVVPIALLVLALLVPAVGYAVIGLAVLMFPASIAYTVHERRAARAGGLPKGVEDPLAAIKERLCATAAGCISGWIRIS